MEVWEGGGSTVVHLPLDFYCKYICFLFLYFLIVYQTDIHAKNHLIGLSLTYLTHNIPLWICV